MIFSKSLDVISRTLRRDMYDLRAPGSLIIDVKSRRSDSLAAVRYSASTGLTISASRDEKMHSSTTAGFTTFSRSIFLARGPQFGCWHVRRRPSSEEAGKFPGKHKRYQTSVFLTCI
jgi:hypothetical protein